MSAPEGAAAPVAHEPTPAPAAAPAAGAPAQQDDYVDKGIAAAGKKMGYDTTKNKGTIEKVTDKIREFIEKKTGKKAPAKLSN